MSSRSAAESEFDERYADVTQAVIDGQPELALRRFAELDSLARSSRHQALMLSDRSVIAAMQGQIDMAEEGFRKSLELDPDFRAARQNLSFLEKHDDAVSSLATGDHSIGSKPQSPADAIACRDAFDDAALPKCLLLLITYNRVEYTKLALETLLAVD